jgi:hypothetical protein
VVDLFRFMRDRKVGEGEASDFDRRDGRQRKPAVSHRRARRSHDWTGHHRWSCPHRAAWPASWTVAALCWPWRKTTQIPTGSGSPHHSLFPPLGVHLSSLCILPLPACLLACLERVLLPACLFAYLPACVLCCYLHCLCAFRCYLHFCAALLQLLLRSSPLFFYSVMKF